MGEVNWEGVVVVGEDGDSRSAGCEEYWWKLRSVGFSHVKWLGRVRLMDRSVERLMDQSRFGLLGSGLLQTYHGPHHIAFTV